MSSVWGEKLKVSIFGGSHTDALGVTLDGLPAGEEISTLKIQAQMDRRAPGQDRTATTRRESDIPHIICGLYDGHTTGAPLTALILNENQHSKDYTDLKIHPRPGHADYTAYVKYHGYNDIRGGGHFSGRLTAPLLFAGSVARQILKHRGIIAGSHVLSVGGVRDVRFDPADPGKELLSRLSGEYFPVIESGVGNRMRDSIEAARECGDSLGGVVECAVLGLPAGAGEPIFGGVENLLSSLLFGIPAVKGVEFGAGFSSAELKGGEDNDGFYYDENGMVRTYTNNSGGILGGITDGMPVIFRVAFKPTPSISIEQDTVDLERGENCKLRITGRHDPCIVPRAAPVVEAAACLGSLELLLESGLLRGEAE